MTLVFKITKDNLSYSYNYHIPIHNAMSPSQTLSMHHLIDLTQILFKHYVHEKHQDLHSAQYNPT